MKTSPSGAAVDASRVLTKLVETFGVQIFEIGTFHSDPHPGNLLLSPDGKTLSLIDFGQCKARSYYLHWSPYDRVGAVNADP